MLGAFCTALPLPDPDVHTLFRALRQFSGRLDGCRASLALDALVDASPGSDADITLLPAVSRAAILSAAARAESLAAAASTAAEEAIKKATVLFCESNKRE